ncbi:MAG TPA: hypothetical protein VD994_04860 [Prosthecobacter sp.]|nr:hypothetical protein [Prosthecobacter sp.]
MEQFADRPDEWAEWLQWMRRLPMFLDLGGLRAVHACWDRQMIEAVRGKTLEDDVFLHATADREPPAHQAVFHLLKGPEMRRLEPCTMIRRESPGARCGSGGGMCSRQRG